MPKEAQFPCQPKADPGCRRADWTFEDEVLAVCDGIEGLHGADFHRVAANDYDAVTAEQRIGPGEKRQARQPRSKRGQLLRRSEKR
jgi:hypothetical protein